MNLYVEKKWGEKGKEKKNDRKGKKRGERGEKKNDDDRDVSSLEL